MIDEDIERMLRKHDEALNRIESSIEQNERLMAAILKSQDIFEKNLASHDDLLEEIQKTMARHAVIFERVEMFHEQYLTNFNLFMQELISMKKWSEKTNGRLDHISENLDRLVEAHIKTDGRLDHISENLDRLAEAQIKTDKQIRALATVKRVRKSAKKERAR
jgi:MoxR-like ATPase